MNGQEVAKAQKDFDVVISNRLIRSVLSERYYQNRKWGPTEHSVAEWILIMEKCLCDAKHAWVTCAGDRKALDEIRQVIAVGFARAEQHDIPLRGEV